MNKELVEVTLEKQGFSFFVVALPKEEIVDQLALASPTTGLLSRMEYENFLFTTLVINLERLYLFVAETTGGDSDEQIELRHEIAAEIVRVNPELDPKKIILTRAGVLKPASEGEGSPVEDNPDWDRVLEDINPYVIVEEFLIEDDPTLMLPPDDETPIFFGKFETVEKKWKRTNIDLRIRKFTMDDLPFIFGPELPLEKELHYKFQVIQKCVEKAEAVFALCDAMHLTVEVGIPTLAEEIYLLCVEVNPFLKLGEINLDDLKAITGKTPKRGKRSRRTQGSTKKGSGRVFADITKKDLLSLSERMKSRIVGQEEAVDKIVDTIQVASCGLRDPEKPIATYLMCGTTGIGKTLTAKVLAEELCGDKNNMVRVDCSEYTQQHDVQKLIGAPPSYVGYEDGGFLTNAVQENPFTVVLFDEIEKAHNKLFDLLLQILDDARLTDGKGTVTDFKDCVVLMTSNIGVSESEDVKSTMGFGDRGLLTTERQGAALKKALKKRFRPEFLNRVDETLNFHSLTKDDALKVADLLLDRVKGFLSNKSIEVEFTDRIRDMVFDKGFSKKYGARPLQRTIDREIVRVLAKKMLNEEIRENSNIRIDYKDGELKVREIKPRVKVRRSTTKTIKKA